MPMEHTAADHDWTLVRIDDGHPHAGRTYWQASDGDGEDARLVGLFDDAGEKVDLGNCQWTALRNNLLPPFHPDYNPTLPTVIRIESSGMAHAPGVWRWFEAAEREPRKWKEEYLAAVTNDRLTKDDIDMILKGRYVTHEEPGEHGPTLVLTVQKKRS